MIQGKATRGAAGGTKAWSIETIPMLRPLQIRVVRRIDARPRHAEGNRLVRAEGLEPSLSLRKNGFSYPPRLSPPLQERQGLGSGLSLHRVRICLRGSGAARLVSTPFPAVSGRAWLGIAILQGSPTLSSSASPVSRRALKFAPKSDASADFATPARFQVNTNQPLTRSGDLFGSLFRAGDGNAVQLARVCDFFVSGGQVVRLKQVRNDV